MAQLIGVFGVLAVLAFFLTGWVRHYALIRLLDVPNARSSHTQPTPRGGGLAIVLALAIALPLGAWQGLIPVSLGLALFACVPLAVIGLIDDHGDVPARWRFLVQLLVAAWVLFVFGGADHLRVAGRLLFLGWLGVPLGILFLTWLLNLFNFMDGIDGIEGVEVSFIAFAASCLLVGWSDPSHSSEALVLIATFGATVGFLVWNWPPARIFMGDVGSGVLGFLLASIMLYSSLTDGLSLVVWIILSGIFLVDATLTLVIRLFRGERWYEAHRSHAYQHASRRYGSHRVVTLGVLFINLCWLFPLASAAFFWPQYELWLLSIALAPLLYVAYRLGAGRP